MRRLPVSFIIERDGKLVENAWDLNEPVFAEPHLRRVVDPLLARLAE